VRCATKASTEPRSFATNGDSRPLVTFAPLRHRRFSRRARNLQNARGPTCLKWPFISAIGQQRVGWSRCVLWSREMSRLRRKGSDFIPHQVDSSSVIPTGCWRKRAKVNTYSESTIGRLADSNVYAIDFDQLRPCVVWMATSHNPCRLIRKGRAPIGRISPQLHRWSLPPTIIHGIY